MNYISKLRRVEYIHELIEKGALRSPQELAEKIGCSEKTVRNIINALRDEGLNIIYCKSSRKYIIKN